VFRSELPSLDPENPIDLFENHILSPFHSINDIIPLALPESGYYCRRAATTRTFQPRFLAARPFFAIYVPPPHRPHHIRPSLQKEDIVVMAHLSSHKAADAKEAIEAVGAKVLYLPPYSPDFNPIESVLAKLKTMLRKWKWTIEELWKKNGKLCDSFTHRRV
jgi:hypothetical protein